MLLAAADLLENAPCVVVTGGDQVLAQAALAVPDPAVVVLQISGGELPAFHPAAQKPTDQAAAFVCQGGVCALPVTTAEALSALLRPIGKSER